MKYIKGMKSGLNQELSEFYNFLEEISRIGSWEIDSGSRSFYGSKVSFDLLGLKNTGRKADLTIVLDKILNKEERETIEKTIYGLDPDKPPFETEFSVRDSEDAGNEIRSIRMVCAYNKNRDRKRIQGIFEDVTITKKLEKELIKAKMKADKADRFKSAFLTNLSHEIRNPMNAILGFSELLRPENLNREQIEEYTGIIRNKANYLLSLIDDVIELSYFETGKVAFNKSEFELKPLLNELYNEFEEKRRQRNKSNIELILNIPPEYANVKIYTDPGRLHQILYNLLSNALKFTEKGVVEFGYKLSPKQFKFYVSDTGIGLSSDEQLKIFNRFAELEETSIRRLGGSGLNLTISKMIVEFLGGKIKVKSEPGQGSRFQINIPVEKPRKNDENMAFELESILKLNWKDKVILVAEDEEVNYRFLEAILQKTQAKVLRAKNGLEAVDLCRSISKIDLVLMDIKMPHMNGYEAIIEIRKFRPDLPIIAQTAFSIHEEIEKCQQVGCNDYVTKPIDINLLVNKINKHF